LFLERLQQTITEHSLIQKGEQLLVGVSGGPDSIALLHGLHQLQEIGQWSLFVIHVNHGLRGEESDQDALYVREFCQQRKIPCYIRKVDVAAIVAQQGGNKQAIARQKRYEQFLLLAEQLHIHKIMLAHHADDQAETILLHLLRGTGVSGLAGMRLKRRWKERWLIRPLLGMTREEIELYCREQQLNPRHDTSNNLPIYTRNRIRHELLPQLETFNPKIRASLCQLAEIVQNEEEVWEQHVESALKDCLLSESAERYTIDADRFCRLSVALQRRLVKLILNYLVKNGTSEITSETVEQVRRVMHHPHPSVQIDLPHGLRLYRQYEQGIFTYQKANLSAGAFIPTLLHIPGITHLPSTAGQIEAVLTTQRWTEMNRPCTDWIVFDADALDFPLQVRPRRPGDRMRCFGMNGSKTIKRLLMEGKIPVRERAAYPLVTDLREQIIWVPGIRRSSIAPVTEVTRRYLYLLWRRWRS
jgi:tRNA(Ile)-lysidine synthase